MKADFPDFREHCEKACRKLWGEPTRETKKEIRWTNGDAYGGRTYSKTKKVWYDRDAQSGGSTLDLVAYSKGEPIEKISGAKFYETWRVAHKLGYVPDPPPEQKEKLPIRRVHPYHDENGELLFQVVRYDTEDKDRRFRQRRQDGKGGFYLNMNGVKRVLYRLPELVEGVSQGHPVLVCEGEHDGDTARDLGFISTTPPEGAEKPWRDEYSDALRDADVIVVSDNDANGRGQRHAENVAQALHGVAGRVRVIIFPVKDLSEWIAAGRTREELDALIEAAPDYVASRSEKERAPVANSEDAIALRFAEQHAETFRYVAASNEWMRWHQSRWRAEDTLEAFDTSRKLCRAAGDAKAKTVAAVVALARRSPDRRD